MAPCATGVRTLKTHGSRQSVLLVKLWKFRERWEIMYPNYSRKNKQTKTIGTIKHRKEEEEEHDADDDD